MAKLASNLGAGNARAADWQAMIRASLARSFELLRALLLGLFALAFAAALLSYDSRDAALNSAAGDVIGNWLGRPGALLADAGLTLGGVAAILLLPLMLLAARRMFAGEAQPGWRAQIGLTLAGMLLVGTALALWQGDTPAALPASWGGLPGLGIARVAERGVLLAGNWAWAARAAAVLLLAAGGLALVVRGLKLERGLLHYVPTQLALPAPKISLPRRAAAPTDAEAADEPAPRRIAEPDRRPPPEIAERPAPAPRPVAAVPAARQGDLFGAQALPALDLLDPPPPATGQKLDKAALERNARLLESVLDDFHVKGQIVAVRPGPVVTMYELEPAPGIKASRVIQLAEDIARNMSALSARVSVVPGRTVMGIELPNANREPVVLREMIGAPDFAEHKGALPIILGKNISGDPVIADLAPMPHLLVAGTTGSGKSVGLNSMILSLLYRLTPDQCRMIMIDPKMLELSVYDAIPHLLSPVVTEPAKAVRALKWAVEQMEDRYRLMSSVGVRNLSGFNDKVRAARTKNQPLGRRVQVGYDPVTGQPQYEEDKLDVAELPQIVVVVDELADLMMTAGKEVEFLIQRLAQKARAAGIHLIMATQRPSVDVITGVIKANLPTRISFHVTSKIDSRTILGEQGAEQLLGKGDMLYMAGGKGLTRIHGPFVSDDEVRRVADHWRGQGQPDYVQAVTEEPEDGGFALSGMATGGSAEDDQYARACQIVFESQKASTSWIQRQLRIGYNNAARLIDRMEEDGYVSAPNHVGRREVLRDRNGEPI